MKNKKGFTLVELIGVIVLLGIIALIAVPIINNSINNSREKTYDAQITTIETAAKSWGVENTNLLPQNDIGEYELKLSELVSAGYLEEDDVIDPRDESRMDGCIYITYATSTKTYSYKYNETCD